MELFKQLGLIYQKIEEKNYGPKDEYIEIPDRLMELSTIHNDNRIQEDNLYLYTYIKNFEYFEKNIIDNNKEINNTLFSLIPKIKIKAFNPKKILYTKGDLIKHNIIVIEGKINIYKAKNELNYIDYNSNRIHYEKFNKNFGLFKNFKKRYDIIRFNEKNKKLDKTLIKGDIFIKNKIQESDTIIETRTKCILGYICIKEWKKIISKKETMVKNEIINFLQSINLFKSVQNPLILGNYISLIKKKFFKKGEFLVEKDNTFDNIYIIKHGSFNVFFNNRKTMKINCDINSIFDESEPITTNSIDSKYYIKRYYTDQIHYNLVALGKGEIIGDIEYLMNVKNYLFNIKCDLDNSEIYQFNLREFLKLSNFQMRTILRENANNKINYFKKRIKDIKVVNGKQIDKRNKIKDFILNKLESKQKPSSKIKIKIRNFSANKKLNFEIKNSSIKNENKVNNISRNIILSMTNSALKSDQKNLSNRLNSSTNYSKEIFSNTKISSRYKPNYIEDKLNTDILLNLNVKSNNDKQKKNNQRYNSCSKENSILFNKNDNNSYNFSLWLNNPKKKINNTYIFKNISNNIFDKKESISKFFYNKINKSNCSKIYNLSNNYKKSNRTEISSIK